MTHVQLALAPHRAALPRVVSAVHAKGWAVEHLHVEGAHVCLLLAGSATERAVGVLARLVDVLAVSASPCARTTPRVTQLPTRYLVSRQRLSPTG